MMETHRLERKEPLNPVRLEKMFLYKFPVCGFFDDKNVFARSFRKKYATTKKTNETWLVHISMP